MEDDVQLRVLASAILFRACLRALPQRPSAEQKMALHARVEHAAWEMAPALLARAEGRDVDDGAPAEWSDLVARLVAEALNTRGA